MPRSYFLWYDPDCCRFMPNSKPFPSHRGEALLKPALWNQIVRLNPFSLALPVTQLLQNHNCQLLFHRGAAIIFFTPVSCEPSALSYFISACFALCPLPSALPPQARRVGSSSSEVLCPVIRANLAISHVET